MGENTEMLINKETMRCGLIRFLENLFSLPEVEKIQIKGVEIKSVFDSENIEKAINVSYHDSLSDIDFSIWVRQSPEDFADKEPVYRKHFSRLDIDDKDIFGILFQARDSKGVEVHRLCLKDGFRADLIFYPRCEETMDKLPDAEESKWGQEDSFWFMAIQALAKLLRRDYLISDHLTHMLLTEGLVLQMIERDKKYETNFHRYGYAEKIEYQEVSIQEYTRFFTDDEGFNHIAENLIRAVISYDTLRIKANPEYLPKQKTFFEIWEAYLRNS